MLSLNAGINPLQNARIGLVDTASLSATQGPQSLKQVIDQLAQSVTKDGHLDRDTPLGQMIGKEMDKLPFAHLTGGNPDMIKAALGNVIKDKLGDNFGAAADFGLGGGAGKPDLMSQVLNGLGKASLDDLLSKQGDGTKFSSSDMPLLDKVAQFMDQNPSKFPPPDSGSWKNELKEDNYLDSKETGAFRAALDMLGGQLEQQQNGLSDSTAGGPLGNNTLAANPSGGQPPLSGDPSQDLGQLLGGLLQKGLDATTGNNGGGDLGKLLGGLLEKGLEASLNPNGASHHNQLFAQHDLQSSLAQAAESLVQALVGGGNGTNSLS